MRIIAVDDKKQTLDALVRSIRKAAPEAEISTFNDAVVLEDQPCEADEDALLAYHRHFLCATPLKTE